MTSLICTTACTCAPSGSPPGDAYHESSGGTRNDAATTPTKAPSRTKITVVFMPVPSCRHALEPLELESQRDQDDAEDHREHADDRERGEGTSTRSRIEKQAEEHRERAGRDEPPFPLDLFAQADRHGDLGHPAHDVPRSNEVQKHQRRQAW